MSRHYATASRIARVVVLGKIINVVFNLNDSAEYFVATHPNWAASFVDVAQSVDFRFWRLTLRGQVSRPEKHEPMNYPFSISARIAFNICDYFFSIFCKQLNINWPSRRRWMKTKEVKTFASLKLFFRLKRNGKKNFSLNFDVNF